MTDPTDFYLNKEEPTKSCLLALRAIILESPEIEETTKYGMPCFCLGNKALVYLWTDKKTKEPYILFVDGNLVDHPELEAGGRARMKILRIDPRKDIDLETIKYLLNESIKMLEKLR